MTRLPTRLVVGILALVLAHIPGLLWSAASAANPFTACRDGQQVTYTDPLTGKPFTADKSGHGRCVNTLARGGQLVPVAPRVTGTWVFLNPDQRSLGLRISAPDGVYPVTIDFTGPTWDNPYFPEVGSVTVTAGTAIIGLGSYSGTWTVVLEDQMFTYELNLCSTWEQGLWATSDWTWTTRIWVTSTEQCEELLAAGWVIDTP